MGADMAPAMSSGVLRHNPGARRVTLTTGDSRLTIVVATARDGGIGLRGNLLFHQKTDLAHFRAVTRGRPVIMGRKTWESLPKRPLPARPNLVVTRNDGLLAPGAFVAPSLGVAIEAGRAMAARTGADEVCIIGGAEIYAAALPVTDRIWLTEIQATTEADAFFPKLDPARWTEVSRTEHPAGEGDDHPIVVRDLRRVSGAP
jgi:dihydrofolate reductase